MMHKVKKIPRNCSLVKFNYDNLPGACAEKFTDTFKKNDPWVFLGDIPNEPGHCVVLHAKTGLILVGYHTDNFIELTKDEV